MSGRLLRSTLRSSPNPLDEGLGTDGEGTTGTPGSGEDARGRPKPTRAPPSLRFAVAMSALWPLLGRGRLEPVLARLLARELPVRSVTAPCR